MAKKSALSIAQHRQLGLHIEASRLAVMHAYVQIARAYPCTTKQRKFAEKALSALGELKSALDTALFKEFPNELRQSDIYYGRSDEAAKLIRDHHSD